jgi:hypothetical protein
MDPRRVVAITGLPPPRTAVKHVLDPIVVSPFPKEH